MAKVKLFALIVALLMLSSLTSIGVSARNRQATAEFGLDASGGCLVVDGLFSQSHAFVGTGALNFAGTAFIQELTDDIPGWWIQTIRRFQSHGEMNANWNGRSVSISFLQKETTTAYFGNEIEDAFPKVFIGASPFQAPPRTMMLRYAGTYIDEAGTHNLSGYAAIIFSFMQVNAETVYFIRMDLFDDKGNMTFQTIWYSSDFAFDPVTMVPPADSMGMYLITYG